MPRRLLRTAQRPQPLAGTSAAPTQGGPEFEHIVWGTDEHPFAPHLPHPAQQELPIGAPLLDLAEDRLDNRFAPRVAPSPRIRPERAARPVRH